ncbi:radical SAM/SPASM domain-containing protein [Deferrisoma camini]|uniref:radical SAM/SPASM domain-containing protein n=1 Tax=Deferrisoma camini TaxID=1035120 RepID=UPI00046CD494|nr:radical SAM protein [Deferrisoma camini]
MELTAPLTVNWTLSYTCNFSCRHCYSRGQARSELPLERVLGLVEELARCRVLFVNFGGGEPLCYPHLWEVARAAADRGLRVSMNTNGWLLDAEAARRARAAGFASVGVSLDGATAEVHDAFRARPGSFDRALAALEHLRAAGVTSTVSAVIHRNNVGSYRRIVELAAERGATTVYLHNFKCAGRGAENRAELDLSPGEWRAFYEDALAWRPRAPAELSFDDPILALLGGADPGAVKGSTCGKLSLHLEPDGEVTPCGFIPVSAGNLIDQPLDVLWRTSPVLRKMREKTPEGKCRSCGVYGECLGGCTARAFAATGSFNAPDPHCWAGNGRPQGGPP